MSAVIKLLLATGRQANNPDLTPYTPTFTELLTKLSAPVIGNKDGDYFIRCSGTKRNNTDTSDTASILIIDGDSRIDTETGEVIGGAPAPDLIHSVLKHSGINHLIYSSFSNGVDYHKYRVIIPCTYTREQLPILLNWIFKQLHNNEVMLAPVPENRAWSQAWYFPRVPDQARADLFEFLQFSKGDNLDALKTTTVWLKERPPTAAAKPEPLPKLHTQKNSNIAGQRNPITEFNQAFFVDDILKRNGYIAKPSYDMRWLCPTSESGVAGVQLAMSCNDEVMRVYSHHNDVLNDGFAHDPFDCYRLLECGGDLKKALNWNDELTKHNQNLFAKEQAALKGDKPSLVNNTTAIQSITPSTKPSDINPPLTREEAHLYNEGVELIDIVQNRIKKAESEQLRKTPLSTHNAILDSEQHHCTVDFLKYVDNSHLLKQMALSIAKATHLPVHTVFIMGLGVFASVACRRWRVEYQYGGSLPIGLYVVAEQPSGAAKSRCLNTFQSPFYAAEKEAKNTAQVRLNQLKDTDKKDLTDSEQVELEQLKSILKSSLFTTNSTPEALEQSLTHSGGYFSAVSSEQGLFNTMLGGCYGNDKASNNDLLLNGFDGGYMSSKRVGRDAYTGATIGGAVMFAQMGGIETLLKASNGTGLAERFLLIAEKHNLGNRDHTAGAIINQTFVDGYNAICSGFAKYAVSDPVEINELARLDICGDGWRLIAEYRNSIEHHLADGGRYSHIAIRGAAAKVDMQIMKVGANLHLLDNYQNKTTTIDLKHIKAAIEIANAMLESILKLCTDKGIVGVKAEYTAILSLFESNNKPRTEREIIQSKIKTIPFKDFTGNKSKLIKDTLADMVRDGLLMELYTQQRVKMYGLAQ